ncbi:hypothetical protein T492DRAFT_1065126 [Pavlovales sp. CCMP2436]|nr:hypothetical protein T492DRAFT_1065126 [Pavlovales sp. CCMP2436]
MLAVHVLVATAWAGGTPARRVSAVAAVRGVQMQHHPFKDKDANLANAAWDPYPFYEPDVEFVGTMRPGTRPENAPYKEVMARAHLCDNRNVVEWSLDERAPIVREPDTKFVDWITANGLLYNETGGNDQAFTPVGETAVVLEDEFEFDSNFGGLGFEDGESLL